MSCNAAETLFYQLASLFHSRHYTWRQALQRSQLLQFTVNLCPRLVQYIPVSIRFLLTVSKEGHKSWFFRLVDTRHIQHTRCLLIASQLEVPGDSCQLKQCPCCNSLDFIVEGKRKFCIFAA